MKTGYVAWIASGCVVGALSVLLAAGAAGAGHGTYLPAAVLFPFTMLLAHWAGTIGPAPITLALAQFPVYGFLVARSMRARSTLARLAGLHGVAATLAVIVAAT